MAEIKLAAETGRPRGSRAARRLRRAGRVPGVVYGHGMDPLPVSVAGRELRAALSGEAGTNALLSLDAGGTSYLTLARELQRDPVRSVVTHVDFQIVRRDEIIAAEVPVTLTGEAIEVHRGDGLVEQQLFTLTVRALPADIPPSIEIDVSSLVIGQAIRLADIAIPDGVTVDMDPEVPIVAGQPPRVQAEAAEEAEEVAEAAGAEGAPGEPSAPETESTGGEG
jgi:large subunit ribosomal protein L25